ncbi:MAG: hypothetical protein FWH12_05575 [Treponema sp.]|nr:hypothetical protein [Treponema sp.]
MMKLFSWLPLWALGLILSACSLEEGQLRPAPFPPVKALDLSERLPEPPALLFKGIRTPTETEILFSFSAPVELLSLNLWEGEYPLSYGGLRGFPDDQGGYTLRAELSSVPGPALSLRAELRVEDQHGQVLELAQDFMSRNPRPPALLINELRTEYSSPRSEYIEFKILEGGNLGALRVFAASNDEGKLIYQFQPVEVKAGDYVVLHLRTLEASARSEYGDNLAESGQRDASPHARDIYIPGSAKLLRKTDAVYVLDQDDGVLTALMLSEQGGPWWTSNQLSDAAVFLYKAGAWMSPHGGLGGPDHAVNTADIRTSITRSVSRHEGRAHTGTHLDWYLTGSGNLSPGGPNLP